MIMKYNSKVFSYGLSLVTAVAAFISAGGPLQAQEKKPNIILIVSDDFGYGDNAVYECTDSIAREFCVLGSCDRNFLAGQGIVQCK